MNNLEQLQSGWYFYVDDNNDALPPDIVGGNDVIGPVPSLPGSWVVGNTQVDTTSSNIQSGVLFNYVNGVGVYHCPSDRSTVTDHPGLLRTRSYSANSWLDGNGKYVGTGDIPPPIEPLQKSKLTQITDPGPDQTFVFIDEQERRITGGSFYELNPNALATDPEALNATWWSLPSDRHNQGGNLSFADGHADHWHWKWPKKYRSFQQAVASKSEDPQQCDLQDLRRLQACPPRR